MRRGRLMVGWCVRPDARKWWGGHLALAALVYLAIATASAWFNITVAILWWWLAR